MPAHPWRVILMPHRRHFLVSTPPLELTKDLPARSKSWNPNQHRSLPMSVDGFGINCASSYAARKLRSHPRRRCGSTSRTSMSVSLAPFDSARSMACELPSWRSSLQSAAAEYRPRLAASARVTWREACDLSLLGAGNSRCKPHHIPARSYRSSQG